MSGSGNVKLRFEYWPIVWFWPLSLAAMQLTLVRIGDFQVTWAVIACHGLQLYLVTFYWLRRPSDRQMLIGLGILLYALVVGLSATEAGEFWKSLAHIVNLLLMLAICRNARLEAGDEIARSLAVFVTVMSAVGLLIIAQAVSFNLYHDFTLAGLLGPLAPLGPGNEVYLPAIESRLPRANGLYAEPSVAGWLMTFAAALALAARPIHPWRATLAAAVCLLAAIATLSLTGILGAAIVALAYILFVRDRLAFKLVWAAITGVVVLTALHVAHDLGILDRFRHFDTPGTSIYFRLNAPSRLIVDSMAEQPFGHAVGQTAFIAKQAYYINWDRGSQTDIDNTPLLIVFYFGLLGVLVNAAYLLALGRFLLLKRHAIGLVMLALLIAFVTTGAGWAHDFALLLGYAMICGRHLLARGQLTVGRPSSAAAPLTRLPKAWRPDAGTPGAARLRAAWRLAGGAA